MNAVVALEWKFSPPDYFEEVIKIPLRDCTMTIAFGQVDATINSQIYEANPGMRQRLHDSLNDRLLGVQLMTHRAYELSRSTMTRVYPDGRRDVFIEPEPVVIGISAQLGDVIITNKDGNIKFDSKRERIEKKRRLAELVAAHRASDPLLARLLRSHDAAVRDPDDELVHLYEVRDALSTHFGTDQATQTKLGISSKQWSRFGKLCNTGPLRQGRHRGETSGALRSATEVELTEARGITLTMIEAYLQLLEASGRT